MWTRKNKTRLGEWEYTLQKPMANDIVMRNWLFVSIKDWYIIPADETTFIEWCAINDRYSWENNEHRYCIYQPKRNREAFTMEVDNGTITQADVGKTFRIVWTDQHINYTTKAEFGGQFRLEEVLNNDLWVFTYNFDVQFAPQWPQGNDWDTPTLEMWDVTKLQPDQNPTVELVQDPNNPSHYTINMGIPAGATWPRGQQWDQWNTGNPWATWQPGQDWTDWINWTNWIDWISPHWEWNWNGGTTYTKLAMVRYPDTDNVYWTWIRTDDAESWATPGVDTRWKKMNRDGDTWPQWDAGGTIVVPVEWKPWKDWIGVDWRDWKDWISPHNEWIFDINEEYSALALVRAWTGKYNAFWDEIRWWFITRNWATGEEPYESSNRELVVEDWNWIASVKDYIDELHRNCVTLWLFTSKTVSETFYDDTSNMDVSTFNFDKYTGNHDMIMNWWNVIKILKDWYYQVSGHCILKLNTWSNQYLNIGRYSVALSSARSGSAAYYMLATGKAWWPTITASEQWPWLDLSFNIQVDLYEWDMLLPLVRCQSDVPNLKTQNKTWTYKIIWWDDTTGSVPWQLDIDWYFATYLSVEMLSYEQFNDWNIRENI